MKKLLLVAVAAATAWAASAQMAVLKEAERAMKGGKDAAEVVKIITPAFTDPETADMAMTWYVPGAADFKQYDHMLGLRQLNTLPEGGEITMGHLLIDGYGYFMKALPLDSVPDAKGKIKPKYSKEIVNTLVGHFLDYRNTGADLFNAKDYQGAYDLWSEYVDLAAIPAVRKGLESNGNGALAADTTVAEVAYNQALAAWQADKLDKALAAFRKAVSLGYTKKHIFDYAISVAQNLKDQEAILEFAQMGLPLYGKDDSMYMSQIVNYYLQKKDYDTALNTIQQAIELEPNNAEFYVIRGVLYENTENLPDNKKLAKDSYKQAMDLNPNNPRAVYYYGRMICDQAFRLDDEAPTRQDEYDAFFAVNIKPLFLDAAEVLEKAYTLDPDNTDILRYLENVYYKLSDGAKLEDVKKRMAY